MTDLKTNTINWQTRAIAYELLAFSFRHPNPNLVDVVASGEWAEATLDMVDALKLELPEKWNIGSTEYEGRNTEELLHAIRVEATRLFVGPPKPAISPYEGVWRAGDDGIQALLFVNPHSMAVERFMKSCGIGRPEGTNEPLDRIDTELEFLQYLCMLEAGLVEPPEGAETPKDGWAGAHKRFLEEHALTWIPRFANKTVSESREPFYRTAGRLLSAVFDSMPESLRSQAPASK